MRPDQLRGTMHSSPKHDTRSDRSKPNRGNGISSACLGDEATQTTANFSENTLNPPTSPRSLPVEFKYTVFHINTQKIFYEKE
jgi:hypothetical protein